SESCSERSPLIMAAAACRGNQWVHLPFLLPAAVTRQDFELFYIGVSLHNPPTVGRIRTCGSLYACPTPAHFSDLTRASFSISFGISPLTFDPGSATTTDSHRTNSRPPPNP
ncbi:unnamed protein product, partial [Sphacelaria rigidula]